MHVLLERHSANPDLQDNVGTTALIDAASRGHAECVMLLLQFKVNIELVDNQGRTALQWAEANDHREIACQIRQHATCLARGLGGAICAALPWAQARARKACRAIKASWPWLVLSVVLGAGAAVSFRRANTAGPGQHRATRRQKPHRPPPSAKAQGQKNAKALTRKQPAALPQQIAAKKVARPDVVIEELPAESAADALERLEAELRAVRARRFQYEAERDARREAAAEAARLAAAERLEAAAREAAAREVAARGPC